jgi:predicted CopG family antitoxin
MASRTIALSQDAYDLLARQKKRGESFSDVVRRLAGKRSPMVFVGAWADIPEKEIRAMKPDIRSWKRSADKDLARKLGRRRP